MEIYNAERQQAEVRELKTRRWRDEQRIDELCARVQQLEREIKDLWKYLET